MPRSSTRTGRWPREIAAMAGAVLAGEFLESGGALRSSILRYVALLRQREAHNREARQSPLAKERLPWLGSAGRYPRRKLALFGVRSFLIASASYKRS